MTLQRTAIATVVAVVLGCALVLFLAIPAVSFDADYSCVLEDSSGQLLGAVTSQKGYWHFPPAEAIPEKVAQSLIIFEDKRFYAHHGIDLLALARAIRLNVEQRRIVSGASTLTMQTARIALRNRRRILPVKALEALMAIKLELTHSKQEILALFAAHAPFGGNVVGLEAASWRYFSRGPDELSWAESATLAALPNAPSLITLSKNRERLIDKRNYILHKLHKAAIIDRETLELSLLESLPDAPYPMPQTAWHALHSLKQANPGQFRFQTSLRKDWQTRANDIVRDQLSLLAANDIRNAAVIIIENWSGAVRAYVGNASDPESTRHGHVDIIRSNRSTGSLLKPFLYAASLDDGLITPLQLIEDTPLQFAGYKPENSSMRFSGAVSAYVCLARSLNIPAINLLRNYSIDRFYLLLKRLGMTSLHRNAGEYGLPLIIGGAEGSLWELSALYAGLARNATGSTDPFFANDLLLFDTLARTGTGTSFSAGAAWLTLEALLDVQRPGTAEHWREYESSRKIAWKTGTSQGYRDAWAIGVTPNYTVGVWVGNADGTARPELGGYYVAAPLLFSVFNMLPPSPWFAPPEDGLRDLEVCDQSGFAPGPHCAERVRTQVPASAPYSPPCPWCVTVLLDSTGSWRTTPLLAGDEPTRRESRFVLPARMEQYYRMNNPDYQVLPPLDPRLTIAETASPLAVIYPDEGSSIYVPFDLDGQRGSLVVHAFHRLRNIEVHWHLDGTYLGSTIDLHQRSIEPSIGDHELILVDANGETLRRRFKVLP